MQRRRMQRWARGLAGTGLAVSALHSAPAEAFEGGFRGDVGAFIGYRFGGSSSGLTWGLEARALFTDTDVECGSSGVLPYLGSVVRLDFDNGLEPAVGLALAGGAYVNNFTATGAEGGVGYGFGERGGLRPWIGAEVGASYGVLRLNYLPLQGGVAVNGGLRFPSANRELGGCYVVGRPRRSESGIAPLPGLHIEGQQGAEDLGDLGEQLVQLWSQRARTEWASAPAFTELAVHLACAGAPSSLIQRSYEAAEDELRHGLVSAQVAARFDGGTVHLQPQADLPRRPADANRARVRLAVESWMDGCLQEATAAACARAEAQRCTDPRIRALQQGIAQDEAEHALLAWDVVRWALQVGGPEVHEALEASLDAVPAPVVPDNGPAAQSYGVLGAEAHGGIADCVHSQSRRTMQDVLRRSDGRVRLTT